MNQLTLNELSNASSFEYEGKRYDLKSVERKLQQNVIKTSQRTFVYYDEQIPGFLAMVKNVHVSEKTSESKPVESVSVVNVVKHEIVLPAENKQVMDKLFEMFNKLGDNPTESDYKQAKAMSEITESIVKVAQMNINLLRLQKSL